MLLLIKRIFLPLFLMIGTSLSYGFHEDKKFVIVTASYNNRAIAVRNLTSIFQQNYPHWRLIYINDCSTDGTKDMVLRMVNHFNVKERVTLITNKERKGHLYNQYHAIHSCSDDEIILIVDGDDWLAHNDVLSYLNNIYQDENIWMTYGQFRLFKRNRVGMCRPVEPETIQKGSYRKDSPWIFSHLRTFYAGLFKSIKKADLMHEGIFLPMSADVAMMFPMLEMSGGKFKCITDVLYIYNDDNPLNFFVGKASKQKMFENIIRSKPSYAPLAQKPF